jgi:hypothetical protein
LVTWQVVYHPEAAAELKDLPAPEQVAIQHAIDKLKVHGPGLGHPHSSAVRSAANLRELRPRGGRSPWRALYRQVGEVFVIGAVGPEADVHPRKFRRAVAAAQRRLDAAEE